MNSRDIKMLSEQYSSMYKESFVNEDTYTTWDGYKIELDVEYQDDNVVEYTIITPPNETKGTVIRGNTKEEINAALNYHRQNGEFPQRESF